MSITEGNIKSLLFKQGEKKCKILAAYVKHQALGNCKHDDIYNRGIFVTIVRIYWLNITLCLT